MSACPFFSLIKRRTSTFFGAIFQMVFHISTNRVYGAQFAPSLFAQARGVRGHAPPGKFYNLSSWMAENSVRSLYVFACHCYANKRTTDGNVSSRAEWVSLSKRVKIPGGVLNRNWVGGFGRLNETLTLFKTQKIIFATLSNFATLPKRKWCNFLPCSRLDQGCWRHRCNNWS